MFSQVPEPQASQQRSKPPRDAQKKSARRGYREIGKSVIEDSDPTPPASSPPVAAPADVPEEPEAGGDDGDETDGPEGQ